MKAIQKVIKSDAEWRALLTPEQYRVLREHGTECAFTGPYLEEKRTGTFHCAGCDTGLFRTDGKYESGTGWPSFFEPVEEGVVSYHEDRSYGMRRIEIRCAVCDGHLGHVFPDGPKPTGRRYCTNGAAFTFRADPGE
ncbi:MAG: peptide-methionine (R)-S-oxide reductase MsrB [Beijerinckiaceae bacterium]|jgi:peptide-methionine (R)-S-oxide reductase|nr:peptide-methionine (R)-S-oxide reductase MsrB [Beijerinckiaceae bacterium]